MSKGAESVVDRLAKNCPPEDAAYIDVMFTVSRLLPAEDGGAYKEIMDSVDRLCDQIRGAWQADMVGTPPEDANAKAKGEQL